ncbi:hypothetical protein BDY24DRAFT_176243 [Mrakia frigida]|uniref:uncharacterized protein n=1 Tax=Mrakia frigida TaxID=29902 RepID=UPI003FCBFB1F
MASFTPPRPLPASPQVNPSSIPVAPVTPGPHKARLSNMEGQIAQLVSQRGIIERKHRSENAAMQAKVSEALGEVEDLKLKLGNKKERENELERCRNEGEQMRRELLDEQDLLYKQAQAVLANEQHVAEEILEVRRLADLGRSASLSLFHAHFFNPN